MRFDWLNASYLRAVPMARCLVSCSSWDPNISCHYSSTNHHAAACMAVVVTQRLEVPKQDRKVYACFQLPMEGISLVYVKLSKNFRWLSD